MSVHPALVTLPSPAPLLALFMSVAVVLALGRAAMGLTALPLPLPLLATLGSIAALLALGRTREAGQSFMRAGFHLGTFAFFLLFPVMVPEVREEISPGVRNTIGWCLVLSVVGFEFAYWATRVNTPVASRRPMPVFGPREQRMLRILIYLGPLLAILPILSVSREAGIPFLDLLLGIRVDADRAPDSAAEQGALVAGVTRILEVLLASGGFLSATAASVSLLSDGPRSRLMTFVSWLALIGCAVLGFLTGTRAVFMYAFSPLVVTSALLLARLRVRIHVRWLLAGASALAVVWSLTMMSAIRGYDIRNYESRVESMSPVTHAAGAFNIYAELPTLVQGFPEVFPYQNGRTLIPLVLGWVPRELWPDKPYPFSVTVNFLRGESLEDRDASIATGLVGEGYANFGLVGVFLWSALMGFAARRVDDYLGSLDRGFLLRFHLGAIVSIWAAMIVRGGVPEMFYMGLGIVLLPAGLARYLLRSSGRTRERQAPVPSPLLPSPGVPVPAKRPGQFPAV